MELYARRRTTNYIALTIAVAAAGFGLFWLVAILWTLVYNGLSAVNLAMFTEMTPPPGSAGGLLNAIFGSLVLTVGGTIIGTPIGMMAGTYLAEYGKNNALAQTIRFINDILLSAPSIVVGLFVYVVVVAQMGHFSAWAGIVALANEFTEAVGDLYQSSLIALGFILFLITFIVLAAAKLMLIRLQKGAGA